jgi:hypothetical protein
MKHPEIIMITCDFISLFSRHKEFYENLPPNHFGISFDDLLINYFRLV